MSDREYVHDHMAQSADTFTPLELMFEVSTDWSCESA